VNNAIEPKLYRCFCPKVIGGIGKGLPDTTTSRTVQIRLVKASDDQLRGLKKSNDEQLGALCAPLRSMLARWAADRLAELKDARPQMPDELAGRRGDSWSPLLAIADLAGGQWPARARETAVVLVRGAGDSSDPKILLLADVHAYFEEHPSDDRVTSADLAAWLNEQEHRPWPGWKGAGIKPERHCQAARRLRHQAHHPQVPGQGWEEGLPQERLRGGVDTLHNHPITARVTPRSHVGYGRI
jgi:putative DNA primase/helicase